jgi:hypothetical protein
VAPGRHDTSRASRSRFVTSLILSTVVLLAGCGSKINEANYYRVQNGMNEEAVDDLLGPPHRQGIEVEPGAEGAAAWPATGPAPALTAARTVKTWTRNELVISVVFENGIVVDRRVRGGELGAR